MHCITLSDTVSTQDLSWASISYNYWRQQCTAVQASIVN